MEVNGTHQMFGCQIFFKISLFCVQQKKETHTGLEQLNDDRILIYG